jgi:sulfonate transport system permease protein
LVPAWGAQHREFLDAPPRISRRFAKYDLYFPYLKKIYCLNIAMLCSWNARPFAFLSPPPQLEPGRTDMQDVANHPLAGPLRLEVPRRIDLRALRRIASPIAFVLLWQLGSMTKVIPADKIAAPSTVLAAFWTLTASGDLLRHLIVSLTRVSIGLLIGVAVGVQFALIVGLSRIGDDIIDPTMQMLRTLPYLGMTPLLILWFGIGELPKIALVAFASAFPVYLTLLGGIRSVDPKLIEAARIFGLGRWALIREVILPGALAPALVGLRYSLGAAWLSLVVSEQINADRGIGYLIMDARDFLRTDIIIVGLLVYAILGLATDAIVRAVEARALAWRPSILRREA